MRRLLSAPAVMIVAVSLLAQTSPPSGKTSEHPEPSCIVSGRVVTADDGRPLRSAKVTLVPETGGQKPQLYAVTTDSDGRFSLKDVMPGRYAFAANHTGFVTQYYKTTGTDEGAILWLRPGEHVGDVLFRMIASGVVTGRLTNEDGEPMVNAQVTALQDQSEEGLEDEDNFPSGKRKLQAVALAQTDDRGQYRIFGLSPGEYYLKGSESSEPVPNALMNGIAWIADVLGSEYAPSYYPGVLQVGQAQAIPVKAGEEVQADFFMRRTKTAKISGLVIGKDGPASSTSVRLGYAGDDSGNERGTTTDEKGRFEFKGVLPGSYLIYTSQRNDGNRVYEARGQQKVEVNGEDVDSVIISVGGGTSLQGRVAFDGASPSKLPRLHAVLYGSDEERSWGTEVNKDGTFEIKSVSDGNYGVQLWGLETNWYIKSVRLGGEDVLEKGLLVEKGGSGGKIEIVVSSEIAQLDGSVSDNGTAVAGAHVRVLSEPETPYNRFRARSLRTDQTGHFSFIGLAPGKYRVLARYGSSAEGDVLRSEPQIVTLSERDHKTVQLAVVRAQVQ
jgi:protocatechuate 3,4-dioxygenase beta subunit